MTSTIVSISIVLISLGVQAAAAYAAIRMLKIAGGRISRILVVAALLLMLVRGTMSLYGVLVMHSAQSDDMLDDLFGIALTLLIAAGFSHLAPVIHELSQRESQYRRDAETELRAQEAKYRLLWDNTRDAIFLIEVCDAGQVQVLDYNPSARRLFGLANEAPQEFNLDTALATNMRDNILASLIACARSGKVSMREIAVPTPTGERTFDETLIPVRDDRNRVGRIISILRDITETREAFSQINEMNSRLEERVLLRTRELAASNTQLASAYEELKEAQSRLTHQEKMASLGQLTAGIAHEINNPLAFVSSNIERFDEYFNTLRRLLVDWKGLMEALPDRGHHAALLGDVAALEQEADLEFICNNFGALMNHTKEGTERIRTIVAQLRGFTRLTDGGYAEADINAALEDCLVFVWNELKYKATVVREFGDLPMVECNVGEIKQVIVNLLVNAAHAISGQGCITLRTRAADGRVAIDVADNGAGIPSDVLTKIFDPFFTTKPIGKGTGLGLWISTTIIQKHDGTLTVASTPGEGSTFTVGLPIHHQEVVLS